jgi:hypothetical protein
MREFVRSAHNLVRRISISACAKASPSGPGTIFPSGCTIQPLRSGLTAQHFQQICAPGLTRRVLVRALRRPSELVVCG